MEQFTFFWQNFLSQWASSDFVINEIEYNCAEQYMMAEKARLFNDQKTLDMIMESSDPSEQKSLGRLVEDFDDKIWSEDDENGRPRCWNIVWCGNMAKFSQSESHLIKLFETKGTTLVEASPYDLRWGVGLKRSNPLINNRSNWLGLNWLGEVLTSVREFLLVDKTPYLSTKDKRAPV